VAPEEPTTWESYEDVARHLLNELGDELGLELEGVEGKQGLVGKSGTTWEIDGKGIKADGGAIVVIECRRLTTSKVKQEDMAAIAWRISDVGASGGIVVTPIGAQKGAELVAQSANIEVVKLDENSTTTDYVLKFLDKVFIGASAALAVAATFTCTVEVS
jgi:hypothetical protein